MLPPERTLLRQVLADPRGLPEQLALFAVRHRGEAARRTVDALAQDAEPAAVRAELVRRGRRATVTEGAFVGGPFLLLIPVAFCAALLRQARTALELAALDGRDPTTEERAAELLVLQGVHTDLDTARRALAAHRPPPPPRRLHLTAAWDLTWRMARLLGLLAPTDATGRPQRAVQAGRWLLLAGVFLVGLVAPLVWLPYMAYSYDRATARFTDRAVRHYFADIPLAARGRLDPAALASAGRALIALLVPLILVVGVLATDVRIAGSNWPVLGIVLITGSVAVGAVWQWRRSRSAAAGSTEPPTGSSR
ncbi:hypothetical protein [Streptomyces cylindrosporus]|uniref:Uncharacterized protein n=1 Tax=Streptomyces cylindrosporus TaxID=2927583 RepID=A0ABS9YAU9_9ACTN|nr:hypothetical protein [Streptomyces cylindrosporus]MCI3273685.1 hypothetical protein [Streptomyces cylindrosporus]